MSSDTATARRRTRGNPHFAPRLAYKHRYPNLVLGAATIYYQDAPGLRRELPSLLSGHYSFDRVYVIDGRVEGFKQLEGNDYSTDGSQCVIKQFKEQYPGRIVSAHTDGVWPEAKKRQLSLALAAMDKVDWLLIIDADEWVAQVNWAKLRTELANRARYLQEHKLNFVGVTMADRDPTLKNPFERQCIRPRWFYRPEQLTYSPNKHDKFYRKDDETPEKISAMTHGKTDNIVLHHDNSYRPKERFEAERLYAMRGVRH